MHLANHLDLLRGRESRLAEAYETVSSGHQRDAAVRDICRLLGAQSRSHVAQLAPLVASYDRYREPDADRPRLAGLARVHDGGAGMLRDLQELYQLASFVDLEWTVVAQAGHALRDRDLLSIAAGCHAETGQQLRWIRSQLKTVAPQALAT